MYPFLLRHFLDLRKFHRSKPESVRQWQLERFRSVFEHAKEHSRFYRGLYETAGVTGLRVREPSDIRRIPFVDKALLRSCPMEDHLTCSTSGPGFTLHSTSGSTGEPYRIWSRKTEEFSSHIRVLWMLLREGYHPRKRITMVTRLEADAELEIERSLSVLDFAQKKLGLFRRDIISVYEDPDEILRKLAAEPPDVIWSTPSIMDIVARRARAQDLRLRVPLMVLMSETLRPERRALLKRHMAERVVHNYGLMECPSIGASFDTPDHMEVFAPSVLVEYRRSEEEFGPGVAEVVLTNLVNLTQPFIRYRTGDLVQVQDSDGDFPTKSLPAVLGRVDDILPLKSGRELAHHHAHEMFMGFHECEQWKFVQSLDGTVTLRVKVLAGADAPQVREKALQIWRNRFPDDDLTVEFVEEMGIDPHTGKFKNIEKETA